MIRLLIADDHQVLLDGMKSALDSYEGIEVISTANNGNQVLEILKSIDVDLVLL